MRYELLAVILIILCLIILGFEYLWLSLLAEKQEDAVSKRSNAKKKIHKMIEGLLYCPTKSVLEKETEALKKFIGNNSQNLEIACDELTRLKAAGVDVLGEKAKVIDDLYNIIDPISTFGKILKEGDTYNKGYACRRLADFHATEYIPDIRKLAESKNRDLSYNSAMALSMLGDVESVAKFILRIQNDKKYSHRIIMELFAECTGDRAALAEQIFSDCNEYMMLTTIKAIAPFKIEKFEKLFLEGLKSTNNAMKIACVKAIGSLEKPENEHTLLIALKDKDWVVRSSAIKGLQKLRTSAAISGVKQATQDKEWWVRQAAAQALLEMKVSIKDIEDILQGYDKYAADAVKYSLYRAVDMREDAYK